MSQHTSGFPTNPTVEYMLRGPQLTGWGAYQVLSLLIVSQIQFFILSNLKLSTVPFSFSPLCFLIKLKNWKGLKNKTTWVLLCSLFRSSLLRILAPEFIATLVDSNPGHFFVSLHIWRCSELCQVMLVATSAWHHSLCQVTEEMSKCWNLCVLSPMSFPSHQDLGPKVLENSELFSAFKKILVWLCVCVSYGLSNSSK